MAGLTGWGGGRTAGRGVVDQLADSLGDGRAGRRGEPVGQFGAMWTGRRVGMMGWTGWSGWWGWGRSGRGNDDTNQLVTIGREGRQHGWGARDRAVNQLVKTIRTGRWHEPVG